MSIVIKADNISKAYQLGEFNTGTVTQDVQRWLAKIRGSEDPFLKVGETNDRRIKGTSKIVWSLKDINFEIQKGSAVGIIGRNGAGKSTLLKILSRITTPTTGSIKVKGRIASLLEVGTGFHPELSGRENIFLNGAILGMKKQEIKRKFDEIVAFSGVERYIDTPVKRYSSGMYVRLAFAVAAHLESEILIVDEVLAVGDAEFQKKCLGKMNDVSKTEGRTVLFVSHNLSAVQKLCDSGIFLENGTVQLIDTIDKVVPAYLKIDNAAVVSSVILTEVTSRSGTGKIKIQKAIISDINGNPRNRFFIGESVKITMYLKSTDVIEDYRVAVQLYEMDGNPIANMVDRDSAAVLSQINGDAVITVMLHDIRLYPETYGIGLYVGSFDYGEIYDHIENVFLVEIEKDDKIITRPLTRPAGLFYLTPEWARQ